MNELIKMFSQISVSPGDLDIPQTGSPDGASLNTILQYVFALGAGIAMIVIILAGIQFILSQGDPGKTAKARNTIIYAAVGLVLCALAFSIVRFILGRL
jgi:cytochrome bd-type quinol oxidase subunit 2